METKKSLSWKQKQQLIRIADNVQQTINTPLSGTENGDIAFIQLMRICRDFAVKGVYFGAYKNEEYLIERLKKFNTRFYEDI